jgi:hypothetical protein
MLCNVLVLHLLSVSALFLLGGWFDLASRRGYTLPVEF